MQGIQQYTKNYLPHKTVKLIYENNSEH